MKIYRLALVGILCTAMIGLTGCSASGQVVKMLTEEQQDHTEDNVGEAGQTNTESTVELPEAAEEAEKAEAAESAEQAEGNEDGLTAGWQDAYKTLMKELNAGNFGDDLPFFGYYPGDEEYDELIGADYGVDGYYLYDVDQDDVPELIVKFGTCEADYDGRMYRFDGEKAVYVDEFSLGHSSMASCPRMNGIILDYGHMGVSFMQKITLVDGELEFEDLLEEDIMDDPDASYTLPGEVITGAEYLTLMKPQDTLPMDTYDVWSDNISADLEATTVTNEELEQQYLDVITNNGEVFGITTDGYGGDTGACTMDEYFGSKVNEYAENGMRVLSYSFVDMNQDGCEECVLLLCETGQEEPDVASGQWVILSRQDNTMYAYCINYRTDYTLLENGAFRPDGEDFTQNFRMMFDKEQVFLYYTALDEKHAEAERYSIS